MSNTKIKEINLNDPQSLKDLYLTLDHYLSHALIAALLASIKALSSMLEKNDLSMDDLFEKHLSSNIDDRDIFRLVCLFANSALEQYKSNKDLIDHKFASRVTH